MVSTVNFHAGILSLVSSISSVGVESESVKFFTVVSMIIAISGSTLSAMIAMRKMLDNWLERIERDVDYKISRMKQHLNAQVEASNIESSNLEFALEARKGIIRSIKDLNIIFAIPVTLFVLVAFTTSSYFLFDYWNWDNQSLCRWEYHRILLTILLVINGFAILAQTFSYSRIRKHYKYLNERHSMAGVQEFEGNDLNGNASTIIRP